MMTILAFLGECILYAHTLKGNYDSFTHCCVLKSKVKLANLLSIL